MRRRNIVNTLPVVNPRINRQILKLALPSIFANITVPLVGMVDLAIAGHLGDAACMGGIAIGSMLFDLLYWNMGFLRVGTGGVTAQAYGRKDWQSAMNTFSQGIATALSVALVIWLIQWVFADISFMIVECSPEVERLAREYFFIRVWAAPATLSLMVFKGWFIGMQNTVHPMAVDITVNVVNMVASFLLAAFTPLGVAGVAVGTLIAQYSGLALAIVLMVSRYRKFLPLINIKESVRWRYMKSFFVLNGNLFIRSLCMLVVYIGFTGIAAKYGDIQLAVSSVMMKLLLLYSYFIDGFAYAGEALTGKYIGERRSDLLRKTVRLLFVWCLVISVVSTAAYAVGGKGLFALFTSDSAVVSASGDFLFWLLLMPAASCCAFTWDGIFVGATASKALRNGMIWSATSFVLSYLLLERSFGIQSLYAAYFVHLVVRGLYMTLVSRRYLFPAP